MPAPRPWTDTEQAALEAGHAAGKTLNAIAKELSRSTSMIHGKAKAAGLTFDTTRTVAATQVRVADAKARKAAALLAELEILERNQAAVLDTLRGRADWKTVLRGEGGAERPTTLDFIPARDAREATNARSGSAVIIDRLADQSDNRDLPAVDAWLAHVTGTKPA